MLPDVLGFRIEEGIQKLRESGIEPDSVSIKEYYSPKLDIIGNDRRIVRVKKSDKRIILTVSNF